MEIKVKTSTVTHTNIDIVFMKQEFSFEIMGEVPNTIEKDNWEDFRQFLIDNIKDIDVWDDREGYDDILLRRVSKINPDCTTLLLSIPCTVELKTLAEKCERLGNAIEIIDYLFKHEKELLLGWEPAQYNPCVETAKFIHFCQTKRG